MIGKRFVEIIPQIPANAESICCMSHEEALGADVLKKHDQLQFEEDNGVNRGTTFACIGLLHELSHKRQIECSLQMAIEVIRRNQVLKGHIDERGKVPLLASHHGRSLSHSHNDTSPYYLPPFLLLFNLLHCGATPSTLATVALKK